MKKNIPMLAILAVAWLAVCPALVSCDLPKLAESEAASTETAFTESVSTEIVSTETALDGTQPDGARPGEITEVPDAIFDPARSYARDGCLFLRAEHLAVGDMDTAFPAVLKINDADTWQSFCQGYDAADYADEELAEALAAMDGDFFATHSLLVVVTEGRSGSIRYRVDGVDTAEGKLTVSLTAEVPNAVTMDIVYWCVVIPLEKADAEFPVEVVVRDEMLGESPATEDETTSIRPR